MKEIVGDAAETVTFTVLEVTTTLAESVTRAVRADIPTVAGVHEKV